MSYNRAGGGIASCAVSPARLELARLNPSDGCIDCCVARSYEIDVAFPKARLAIEVDGFRYHSGDERFQRDRTKQNALTSTGWRVLRFTWADLSDRPGYVIEQIRHMLLLETA